MRAKLRGSIQTYLKTKAQLDGEKDPTESLCDKERLQRGIVRGQAMMLLAFLRPGFDKDKDEIESIEQEHGFPHDHRPKLTPSPTLTKFINEYYDG